MSIEADSPWWDRLLDHLEWEQPHLLSQLLGSGELEQYLRKGVRQAQEYEAKLLQNQPDLDQEQLREFVTSQWEPEPGVKEDGYQDLPPDVEEKLHQFKREIIQRAQKH